MAQDFEIVDAYRQQYGREPTGQEIEAARGLSVGQLNDPANLAGGAGGGRFTPLDLSQVPSVLEFAKGLSASEDVVFQDLIKQMGAREMPLDIYTRLQEEQGIPQLRESGRTLSKEIATTEDFLDRVEANVSGRTRESVVTEAQRERMVTSERQPMLDALSKLGIGFGRIQSAISERMQGIGTQTQLAMAGQAMGLEPYQLRYSAMVDRNARYMTGFTADRETKLTEIVNNWQRGNTISDQEWELANTLASEEKTYLRALQTAAAEAGATITGNEDFGTLLALIGKQAQEEIAWDRRATGTGKGSTAAQKEEAKRNLAQDASGTTGISLADAQRKYAGTLTEEEIVYGYQANTGRGQVVEPYAQEILGIYDAPKVTEEGDNIVLTYPDGRSVTIKKSQ